MTRIPSNIISPTTDPQDMLGVLWLSYHFDIRLWVKPYVISQIGASRRTLTEGHYTQEIYPARTRLGDNVAAHLTFYLKNEIPILEFLARLFYKIDGRLIQDWVNAEPTGRYARRVAFLYEWLTDERLEPPSDIGGGYVDVLDGDKVVVANTPIKDNRWRVNNNIAGTKDFAPMVVKTPMLLSAIDFDVKEHLTQLRQEFGEDLLVRASVWITLRESRASFTIEGEGGQESRIERFARVIAEQVGQGEIPLSNERLGVLQEAIIGKSISIKHFGLRQSPVFVGESNYRHAKEIVHYIAPPCEEVPSKLEGLNAFFESTKGQSSLMRSAVIAFGFVYIHPLADGNGRIHRFLMNDVLRRDGQTDDPMILPISKAIIDSPATKRAYDAILDIISKPLMQSLKDKYHFTGKPTTYADGIKSNLVIQTDKNTQSLWQYMDLTAHTQYLSGLMRQVIGIDMVEESAYLRTYDKTRQEVKEVIEMSNQDADRIIRSILDNKGVRSNKLVKEYELLGDDELWERLVGVVNGMLDV